MNTGIPNFKRKIFYDLPSKFVECCRDIPWVAARCFSSETASILKAVFVFADYVHACVKHFNNPAAKMSNLTLPTLNVALRTIRVILDPCFKYLSTGIQAWLNKSVPFIPALSRQVGLAVGLGIIHLSVFAYLTIDRCKKLIQLYRTLPGYTYEENKGGKVYTKDIRVKLASVGLKLATIALTFVAIGLGLAGGMGLFGLGAGAIQAANVCFTGSTIAGTVSWTGLLAWKHFTYNPKDPDISSPSEGTRGAPSVENFLM